jgi:DNA-binding NarL/FixJ family response regulator
MGAAASEYQRPRGCLVACGDSILRAGLRFIVESQPDLIVLAEASDGEQVAELAATSHPDIILMDVELPGINGIDVTRSVLRSAMRCDADPPAVVVLASDEASAVECLRAGARGYLLRTNRPEALLSAIRTALSGHAVLDPRIVHRLVNRLPEPDASAASAFRVSGSMLRQALRLLSPREREVLAGLARGRSNRQLAKDFGVREATVKTHVSRLLGKLGVNSRAEAIALAYQNGIVPTPGRAGGCEPFTVASFGVVHPG